ncbi:MAG: peptidase domain-containing ABC transporter, partial [Pseudomonadota bacterium]
EQLLIALAVGFALLTVFSGITEYIRSYLVTAIGQNFSFQIIGNVLRHLLRLKTEYFEKRSIGDVTSRIGSIQQIKQVITQDFITIVIDGVMSFFMLGLMFLYDARLAAFVLVTTAIHLAVAQLLYPAARRREEKLITAMAREESYVIESVRAARAIKLFGREAERETGWRNLYSDVVNNTIERDRVRFAIQLSATTVFGVQLAGVAFFGALLVLNGSMSLGMLFAFVSFRQTFAMRAISLVQQLLGLRMLALHLDRVADIVLSDTEDAEATAPRRSGDKPIDISLEDVAFRYSYHENDVLDGVSLNIRDGEFIAITGVSGGGKTTLLKLLLGLLEPSAGAVRVGGKPLHAFGLSAWRAACGVVMQDDQLLSGTIADNISFYDPQIDMEKVRSVAKIARIHDDIVNMPMEYLSLIGDMGSSLSGGQRQRLMLARALYHDPRILILDEGTANLDRNTEREIADAIENMPITRIVIAHRQELINRADTVYVMRDRKLFRTEAERLIKNDATRTPHNTAPVSETARVIGP